jgi:hypothetical protein
MKKFFSFALAAMMSVAMLTLVGCNKDNKKADEPVWETPTSLVGTEWVDDGGETWLATITFQTETTGRRTVHRVIDGTAYDSDCEILYHYLDGSGQYMDDIKHFYLFTIDGGTLTVREEGADPEYDEVYKRKK